MLPSAVLTHLKAGVSTALRPEPVRIGWWLQAGRGDAAEARQTIADDGASGIQAAPGEGLDLAAPEAAHPAQLEARRPAVGGGLDGGDDRRLAGRAASPLATRALPAEIGVVHLDAADQALLGIAPHHDLLELVLDRPCRRLGDAEAAAELQAGDALLALGQVIESTKPGAQRELGRREDGPGGQRRLPPAGGALIERAGLDQAVPSAATARADEAVRPPPLGHRRAALLLAAKPTLELGLAQPLLVLNLVPSHRLSPAPASKFSFCTRSGSAEQDASAGKSLMGVSIME